MFLKHWNMTLYILIKKKKTYIYIVYIVLVLVAIVPIFPQIYIYIYIWVHLGGVLCLANKRTSFLPNIESKDLDSVGLQVLLA